MERKCNYTRPGGNWALLSPVYDLIICASKDLTVRNSEPSGNTFKFVKSGGTALTATGKTGLTKLLQNTAQ